MEKDTPVCSECHYMELMGWAKLTANSWHRKGPRGECVCRHPDALETFKRTCPRSPRMPGFIALYCTGRKCSANQDISPDGVRGASAKEVRPHEQDSSTPMQALQLRPAARKHLLRRLRLPG